MIRRPVVAGSFYPGTKLTLERELKEYIDFSEETRKVIGLISPHAGYIYSGRCAGKGFGRVVIPGTVVILGVNHHGYGEPCAVDGNDSWMTPLGEIEVNKELRDKLVCSSDIFKIDSAAGSREHSIEVQVPFIQYLNPQAKILPITISVPGSTELIEGGRELAHLIETVGNNDVLIVASTDMSHYISAESARIKDSKAIDKIEKLDPKGLFQVVATEMISMCGVCPTTMMLSAALEMGAKSAEVVDYTNSGEVSGDFNQVVGYLSMIVY